MSCKPASWPQRPKDSRWTEEQWASIVADGTHLLVAAAAGSGKTAVLVERMIRRIADPERPLGVDELLVATFTKAAADEMKERIRRALEEALERSPNARHLERQLALLPRAAIMTLHSFCLEVVERYAPLIGLDPGFRMANETEAELLRMDTLDELLEALYEEEADDEGGKLYRLAERFGGERSDEPLHRLVLELHAFAASHPWPEYWLKSAAARFAEADADSLLHSGWVRSLLSGTRMELEGARAMLENALQLCGKPGGPSPYAETLQQDIAAVSRVLQALGTDSWTGWQEAVAACQFGRLKACRGSEYDPDLQEQVKSYRDAAKKLAAKVAEEWLVRSPEQYAAEMRELAPDMAALAELTIRFGRRYEAAKRARGLLDFSDLEHYALRILRDPRSTPEQEVPSAAAIDYRRRFTEIYLDEYQDTNEVQEAIVSLISREHPGNRFMVGDVKQSIYRFRLAEPGLFMAKHRRYAVWQPGWQPEESPEGLRIDLARNFRSRREIVQAVNYVFRSIMQEPVGEMNYDRRAELVYGEGYPEQAQASSGGALDYASDCSVELVVVDGESGAADPAAADHDDAASAENGDAEGAQEEELESVQAEARCAAAEIRRLMGEATGGQVPFSVYDGKSGTYRPVQYRDIVILLRATSAQAPIYVEELKRAGIPAYADLATGYFAATEVDVVLSLLRIIDNPRQDIPLAGVLRSPLFGLSADQLARIRLCRRSGDFWDAVQAAAADEQLDEGLRQIIGRFVSQLSAWRDFARREPLGDLLWMLYRETGYYDFVGGMPGGMQRQANLRALVDRARSFEQTSRFRGLFRFLRFLDRMRESGADLGAARALGESENVVRIVSIHKSKGLEFPVVIVAGLGRRFNRQDLNAAFLMHKALGFGPRMIDPQLRVAYPTLPQLAIRRRLAAEMLAEEMRVLYVALTRPKEKLIMLGAVKDASKSWDRWRETAAMSTGALPDAVIASASSYLDWLGPIAVRAESEERRELNWINRTVAVADFVRDVPQSAESDAIPDERWEAVLAGRPVDAPRSAAGENIRAVLSWRYPHAEATKVAAKTSVSAWKNRLPAPDGRLSAAQPDGAVRLAQGERLAAFKPAADAAYALEPEGRDMPHGWIEPGDEVVTAAATYRLRRPRFVSDTGLTAAERGTAYHLVMQHLPLVAGADEETVRQLLDRMTERKLLTAEQLEAIDCAALAKFCRSSLYDRMCRASRIWREVPFTYGVSAREVYPDVMAEQGGEMVVMQGVIDCLLEEDGKLILIDYKTDALKGGKAEEAAEKHRFQMDKYGEAIARIAGRPVDEAYVYFFDGGHAVCLWKP